MAGTVEYVAPAGTATYFSAPNKFIGIFALLVVELLICGWFFLGTNIWLFFLGLIL